MRASWPPKAAAAPGRSPIHPCPASQRCARGSSQLPGPPARIACSCIAVSTESEIAPVDTSAVITQRSPRSANATRGSQGGGLGVPPATLGVSSWGGVAGGGRGVHAQAAAHPASDSRAPNRARVAAALRTAKARDTPTASAAIDLGSRSRVGSARPAHSATYRNRRPNKTQSSATPTCGTRFESLTAQSISRCLPRRRTDLVNPGSILGTARASTP